MEPLLHDFAGLGLVRRTRETDPPERNRGTEKIETWMLSEDQAAGIFERIKKYSTADEVEVIFYGGKSALTRFANNVIHQNVAEENYGISVRTAFGGRTARATTNRLDEVSLRRVIKASESLAKVQHPDPDLLPLAGEGARPASISPSRHFAATAAVTPEQRA